MNKLDYCIKTQFRMIAAELAVTIFMVFLTVLFLSYGGFGGEGFGLMKAIGTPGLMTGTLVSFSALRKLYVRSVYGASSGLYQALPVTTGEQITSKIFAAGVLLLLAFLPAFFIFGNGLGSYYFGRYRIRILVTQVLVNQGYVHAQAPLFAALAVVSLILGCFAAAAAVQLVIAVLNRNRKDGEERRSVNAIAETGIAVLSVGIVIFMNLLPYWLLMQDGGMPLSHPAMLPAAEILLNGIVLLAAGRGSVRAVEG